MSRRAVSCCMGVIGLLHLFVAATTAWAECPTLIYTWDTAFGGYQPQFEPLQGCPFMLVKAWGNGGNPGFGPWRGKGGGGGAVEALFHVQPGQKFRARVDRNGLTNMGWGGSATALHDETACPPQAPLCPESAILVAAGGGGGGASGDSSEGLHGGAGRGTAGQDGLAAHGSHPNVPPFVVHPGLGGHSDGLPGAGGAGFNGHNGWPGGEYPCHLFPGAQACGEAGFGGGHGGEGHFGGGGGGGDGPGWVDGHTGAGGGGGASFVWPDPRLIGPPVLYDDGDRERPGNADDPDRQGAGNGAVTSLTGTPGRVVVKFFALRIIPEETTRWKPQRGNDVPIEVVFDSPATLHDEATLEVTDPNGALLTVDELALVPVTEPPPPPPLHRYRLAWSGHQANGDALPRGNYSIRVRATAQGSTASLESDWYDNVALVEVVGVELCRDDLTSTCSDWTTPHADIGTANPAVGSLPNQVPVQYREGGGKRIFAEKEHLWEEVTTQVKVRAKIEPVLPPDQRFTMAQLTVPVHFKSFDVDDPTPCTPTSCAPDNGDTGTVNDNRGDPKAGTITDPEEEVAPGTEYSWTFFKPTTSPGDNYRVVASTSATWLNSSNYVYAEPASTTGQMNIPEGANSPVSPMLTVWRTLNLELDSMTAPPSEDTAPDPDSNPDPYDERNFIKGMRLLRLQAAQNPRLFVEPEPAATGHPALPLCDGSPQLDNGADGRFQNGRIVIGTGVEEAVTIANVKGNGGAPPSQPGCIAGGTPPEYLELQPGTQISCNLSPPGSEEATPRNIVAFDWATNLVVIDEPLPAWPPYNGGQIRIGGHSFRILHVSGLRIVVEGPLDLPFVLYDDDAESHPFAPATGLLETSDNPVDNPLAQAYVLPRVAMTGEAPFQRNIRCSSTSGLMEVLCPSSELDAQLEAGKNIGPSDTGLWNSYVQGAFQGDQKNDHDPTIEWVLGDGVFLGMTPSSTGDIQGSVVYAEAIRDSYAGEPQTIPIAKKVFPVHELGHQFGLDDDEQNESAGIMGSSPTTHRYFNGDQLDKIRGKDSASLLGPGSEPSLSPHRGTPCDEVDTWKAVRSTPLARETALALSLDRSEYVVGAPLELSLSVKNTGKRELRGRFEGVHPNSPLLRVDYRRSGGTFQPLDRNRRNFHRAYSSIDLGAGATLSGDMWVTVDRGRAALILDEPGTYDFRATFCETPGDSNAVVVSNVVTVRVEVAPEGHRDALREYPPIVAQFAHWPRDRYRSEEVIAQGLEFVERFPDSPWSMAVRRGILADLGALLGEKEDVGDYAALRARYEALLQAARDRGELPRDMR